MNQLKLHISLLKSIPPNSMAPFLLFLFEFSYTASITSSETFTNSKVVIMMFSAYAIVTSREVILARYLYNHLRNYTKILYANAPLPTTLNWLLLITLTGKLNLTKEYYILILFTRRSTASYWYSPQMDSGIALFIAPCFTKPLEQEPSASCCAWSVCHWE